MLFLPVITVANSYPISDQIDKIYKKSSFFSKNFNNNEKNLQTEYKIAQGVIIAGSLLSNKDNLINSTINMARSTMIAKANSSIEQWLNKFGTSRLQLNIDNNFHLDDSALDFMIPFHYNSKSILFTQLGIHNKNGRNIFNIGTGARIFQNNWIFGVNTFFDNEIIENNSRIGVGIEALADYLVLSANSYFFFKNWHQSQDILNYKTKAANGYDLHISFYLPYYTQLSGKLILEKYYGYEVDLFGTNHRQKNPQDLTIELNYTPIAFLTLGIVRRKNDTLFNVQINYRMGESFQEQINPSEISKTKIRIGNRYDLVDRNNHIVLDHQKQQVISLTLPRKLINTAGNTFLLTAVVKAKYGLERIDWDGTSLLSAGGTLTQISKDTLKIKLPSYHTNSDNFYIISAIAYDSKGNASNCMVTQLIVTSEIVSVSPHYLPPPKLVALSYYDFTASKNAIISDGQDETTLTFTAKDDSSQPIKNLIVSFKRNDESGTRLSDISEENGIYSAKLQAVKGTSSKVITITPHVEGQDISHIRSQTVLLTTPSELVSITPNLQFEDAQQSIIYTKNVISTQAIKGMPDHLDHIWSSSDNNIATVDNNGKITLIKSGEVKLTIYTQGNEKYNTAMASYILTIDKADPQLQVGDGNPITDTWGNSKSYSIAATFGNPDVGSSLTPIYTSKNPEIVTVNSSGTLHAIKPGESTTLNVSTLETDQFKATSLDVVYLLTKGTVNIDFDVAEVKINEEEIFMLQKTKNKLPLDADVYWESSDSNIINVSKSGNVQGKVGIGSVRLTLNVLENDFYTASSGYYDVLIYSKPIFEFGEIKYSSSGNYRNYGDWIPVYTDDDIILNIRLDTSNEFNRAESVTVYLLYDSGQYVEEKEVPTSSEIHEIHFSPQDNFWGRNLYFKVIAKGRYGHVITENKSKFISVKAPNINDIGSIKTTATASAIITSTGELDNSCQMSWIGRMHHFMIWPKTELKIPGNKKLIKNLFISHKIVNPTGDSREVNYNDIELLTSSGVTGYKGKSSLYAVKEVCWFTHQGGLTLQTMLRFGEKEYNIFHPFAWNGKLILTPIRG